MKNQPTCETFSFDDVISLVLLRGAYETKERNSYILPDQLSWSQRLSLPVMRKMPRQCCRRNWGFLSLLFPSAWTWYFRHQSWSAQHILGTLLLQKYFQGISFHLCLGEKNGTDFILDKPQKHQKATLKNHFLNVGLFLFKSGKEKRLTYKQWIESRDGCGLQPTSFRVFSSLSKLTSLHIQGIPPFRGLQLYTHLTKMENRISKNLFYSVFSAKGEAETQRHYKTYPRPHKKNQWPCQECNLDNLITKPTLYQTSKYLFCQSICS